MEKLRKLKIITKMLDNVAEGIRISRDMDLDTAERMNPDNWTLKERKFAAEVTTAAYNEAVKTILIMASGWLSDLADAKD